MRTLNLGILAHVDAGKTSLTERLLHDAGVIDEVGRVDEGTTRTDTLALERRRGITIKSAVVSFRVGDVTVNLIDTPGHPDFVAEVERVLGVLDGAVLVVSAVEGVQARTRVLMRTLLRLGIPTLVFVNKIDRVGARDTALLADIAKRLTASIVPMGTVEGLGTRAARFVPGVDEVAAAEVLAEHDDALLADYLDGGGTGLVAGSLARQSRCGLVHPVHFGSAMTGAGVAELVAGLVDLLPAGAGETHGPPSGTVFKVERGPAGERIAYVRMFSGTVRVRDRVPVGATEARVTGVGVFDQGEVVRTTEVGAGRIGLLWGLSAVRIGDTIGTATITAPPRFAPPALETVVVPVDPAGRSALHTALAQLAEQDPLINLRQDDERGEIAVSLYGEVQKEVIGDTLAEEFGIEVTFRETTTVHIERPAGTGEAVELIGTDENPLLATVGLRVEPSAGGNTFRLGVELGSMPPAFFRAVEESVTETLRHGPHGWAVLDCAVTMTRSGYWARQSHAHGTFDKSMSSTAGDFRALTRVVLLRALRAAGTVVHEPVHRFWLEIPADTLAGVLPVLSRLRAVPRTTEPRGASCVLTGDVPVALVHALERRLPGLTRGEGVLETVFDHYAPVRGQVPTFGS
ncbi:GTP-binding protein [Actinophytocola xinjiangensis]|uniref:GTP-binding protein n=1 Tax=Actinophytocola xinjiangensis TaxID=485602 RepID=A0A7Z0WP70_9PSEU|nr:TetM/TetW/TetO/TetS family tetracycline resistance ribosomal protection protein [Actinophytocola xinjiangensis]OLF12210.1 GTP-binding protein [Actinophytocola xinjiangensis]